MKAQLTEDMKSAMKSGEKEKLAVIRLINAALKQREVDERIEITDAVVLAVLEKMVKQRKDSISQFTAAGRTDLADKESAELKVLEVYLPQRLSAEEIDAAVQAIVAGLGATGPGAMGQVMGAVKQQLAGKADMALVSAAVKRALAG